MFIKLGHEPFRGGEGHGTQNLRFLPCLVWAPKPLAIAAYKMTGGGATFCSTKTSFSVTSKIPKLRIINKKILKAC